MQNIRSYGEQKFIDEVLAVAEGKPARKTLLTAFRPLRESNTWAALGWFTKILFVAKQESTWIGVRDDFLIQKLR